MEQDKKVLVNEWMERVADDEANAKSILDKIKF